jgi:hypothetical protein
MILLSKEIKKTFPLIEIIGPVDCGKTQLATLVARRLFGKFISFPSISPFSPTGRELLQRLTNNPRALEENYEWWAHMYCANLYEQKAVIASTLECMPVIITNYTKSFKYWMMASGWGNSATLTAFTTNLPTPNLYFSVDMEEWKRPNHPQIDFSTSLKSKISSNINSHIEQNIIKVKRSTQTKKYMELNELATFITRKADEKYDLAINENQLYNINTFMKKKDLK